MRFSALKMLTFFTAVTLVFRIFIFSDVSTAFVIGSAVVLIVSYTNTFSLFTHISAIHIVIYL